MNTKRVFAGALLSGLAFCFYSGSARADALNDMISPVTHPVVFEDPRHSTEIKPLFAHHAIDNDFATQGGDVNIYAIQARFKVTDNLSIIAVKDGFVDFNPKAVLKKDTGFANIAAGAKYSVYRTANSIITPGLTYEAPVGEHEVIQGNGDGLFNPFVSMGTTMDGWNFILGTGFRVPVNDNDSTMYDLNIHASYKIGKLYPLAEFGLVNVVNAGKRLPIPDEGEDFFNIGSSLSEGKTLTSLAIGARYRATDDIDLGAAWQFPLSTGEGSRILDNRVTADVIIRFDV